MSYTKTKSFILSLLVSCLGLSITNPVRADSTETTVTKTTVSNDAIGGTTFMLPATGSYMVVDPISGKIQGNYEAAAGFANRSNLQAGTVLVDANSGKLVATVDSAGNIVDVSAVPATQTLIVSIDSRRRELNRQIAEELSKGQITPQQAAALRSDLERIAADESTNCTFQKAMILGYSLNTLSQRLVPVSSTMTIQPAIAPEFVTVDGQLAMVDSVTARRLQMRQRIQDEYAAGRLSNDQVSRLNYELDKIASLETRYRRNGRLSESRDKTLSMKLDQVHSSVEHDVAIINQKRSGIGLRVDNGQN